LLARHKFGETALPVIAAGENRIALPPGPGDAGRERVEVTIFQAGKSFGGINPGKIRQEHLTHEYTMPRRIISGPGEKEAWEIIVRPEEKARLEIGITGPVDHPVL